MTENQSWSQQLQTMHAQAQQGKLGATNIGVINGLQQPPTVVVPPPVPVVPAGTVVTPTTITSKPAEQKVQQMTSAIMTAEQQMAAQAAAAKLAADAKAKTMATAFNPTTGERKAVTIGDPSAFAGGYVLETPTDNFVSRQKADAPVVPVAPVQGQTFTLTTPAGGSMNFNTKEERDAYYKANSFYWNQPADLKAEEDVRAVAEFDANSSNRVAEREAEFKKYEAEEASMRNGTFPLTPEQQTQIDDIRRQYEAEIAEQQERNAAYENVVKASGIRSGRDLYTPETHFSSVNRVVSAGAKAISDLDRQMRAAIATAKQAIQDNNIKSLDRVHAAFIELQNAKDKEFETMKKDAQEAFNNDRARNTEALAQARFNFDVEKEKNAVFVDAQKETQKAIIDFMHDHPDAGIDLSTDTLLTASEKVTKSKSFADSQAQSLRGHLRNTSSTRMPKSPRDEILFPIST